MLERLRDIVEHGDRAKAFVGTDAFEKLTEVQRSAVCYEMLIVSEAVGRVLQLAPEIADRYASIPWPQIRAVGNRLRHDYGALDVEIVVAAVQDGALERLIEVVREEMARRAT